jgi:hypothetical protein
MSTIVAARFVTFPQAESAAQKLFDSGFVEEDVSLFYVNPRGQHARYPGGGDAGTDAGAKGAPKGAAIGVSIGAVLGAIIGVAITVPLAAAPLVFLITAGAGAYLGSLVGAMAPTARAGAEQLLDKEGGRESGVLVAAHVSPESLGFAADVLGEAGGYTIERASGRWQNGKWIDFDPLRAAEPVQGVVQRAA